MAVVTKQGRPVLDFLKVVNATSGACIGRPPNNMLRMWCQSKARTSPWPAPEAATNADYEVGFLGWLSPLVAGEPPSQSRQTHMLHCRYAPGPQSRPVSDASPSGSDSLRNGLGAGLPSLNSRGISRARDLVEQSKAAIIQSTSFSWLLKEALPGGIGKIMGAVQFPVHWDGLPSTKQECFGDRHCGACKNVSYHGGQIEIPLKMAPLHPRGIVKV